MGTTNVKAVVVDDAGCIVGSGRAAVDRYNVSNGGIEQDIEQIWQCVCRSIREAVSGLESSSILALGISSQGGAMQLLDREEKPLDRVISWMDSRGQPYDRQLTEELGPKYFTQHVGHGSSGLAVGQILRLREQSPEWMDRVEHIAFVGDVIAGRLCGRRAHDATSLAIALLYNPWLRRADDDLIERLHIEPRRLPDMVPATEPAGRLTQAAAVATGLPVGIPVSGAVHDQYAGALGAGSVEGGNLFLGTGTAWVLLANSTALCEPVTPGAFVCQHPVEGITGQMLSLGTGGSAIEWAMNFVGKGAPTCKSVDGILTSVPAGSEGLCFWPLLSHYAEDAGQFGAQLTGIKTHHAPEHFVRSVVEGLACELARHLNLLDRAGIPTKQLIMCGEAAASTVTPRIIANVTGKPVSCIEEPAVSAYGATILARALANPMEKLERLSQMYAPKSTNIGANEDRPIYQALLARYLEPFVNSGSEKK